MPHAFTFLHRRPCRWMRTRDPSCPGGSVRSGLSTSWLGCSKGTTRPRSQLCDNSLLNSQPTLNGVKHHTGYFRQAFRVCLWNCKLTSFPNVLFLSLKIRQPWQHYQRVHGVCRTFPQGLCRGCSAGKERIRDGEYIVFTLDVSLNRWCSGVDLYFLHLLTGAAEGVVSL